MNTTIDDVKWRLRFRHTRKPPATGIHGVTQCWVEVWEKHVELEGWFSVPGAYGETRCGRRDNFTREVGRQFAMVRALRGLLVKDTAFKPHIAALLLAYAKSSPSGRLMCDDLFMRGFKSLYDAVFDPDRLWDFHTRMVATQGDGYGANYPDVYDGIIDNPVDSVNTDDLEA
jgi:hypothetical protein